MPMPSRWSTAATLGDNQGVALLDEDQHLDDVRTALSGTALKECNCVPGVQESSEGSVLLLVACGSGWSGDVACGAGLCRARSDGAAA